MTEQEFLNEVRYLGYDAEDAGDAAPDLETYLRALYGVLRERREAEQVEFDFLAEALTRAFTAESVPFEESWRGIVNPYEEDFPERSSAWTALERTLLFQIADLRRLADEGEPPGSSPDRAVSSTGHEWYNGTLGSFLSAASYGVSAKSDEVRTRGGAPRRETGATWLYLEYLLGMGQYYE